MTNTIKERIDDIKNLLFYVDIKNIDRVEVTENITTKDICEVAELLSDNDKEKIYAAKLIYKCCKNATPHIRTHMGVQNLLNTINELQEQLPLSVYLCLLMLWYNDTSTKPSKKAPIYEIKQCISNCQKQDLSVLLYLLHFQELYDLLAKTERDINFKNDNRPSRHLVAETFQSIEKLLFNESELSVIQECFYGYMTGNNEEFEHLLNFFIYKEDENDLKTLYIKAKFRCRAHYVIFDKKTINLLQKQFGNELITSAEYVKYVCEYELLNETVINNAFESDYNFEVLCRFAKQHKKYIKSLQLIKELQ